MSYRKIGELIQLVDERNKDLNINNLIGLTINKVFIPSVANIIGTDMSNYKIIRKNQFACSTMQVRRDKKMPIALLQDVDVAIISQAYPVFEVIDVNEVLPEYLMMWFTRSEFDREACFHAVGGVRGSIEWEDFCNLQLPIPSIDKQRAIVAEYQSIENKIAINNQICEKLEATAQALYRHWFVDFEFPNEDGKPYKSSGGAMVYNEEMEKEIPEGWEVGSLGDVVALSQGIQVEIEDQFLEISSGNRFLRIIDYSPQTLEPARFVQIFEDKYYVSKDDVVVIRYGNAGTICRRLEGIIANNLFKVMPTDQWISKNYLYYFLNDADIQLEIKNSSGSSTMPAISHSDIKALKICYHSSIASYREFDYKVGILETTIIRFNTQNQHLTHLQSLLLSRLAKQAN